VRYTYLFLAAAAAASIAAPASAAIVLNTDGSIAVSSDTTVGDSLELTFNGSSSGQTIDGLSSSLVLTFAGLDGANFVFGYSLTNTSVAPLTSANVMGFGFDVAGPQLLTAGVTGDLNTVGSGSISNGVNVDVCFKSGQGNNCAGGGNLGFATGDTAAGQFRLGFADGTTSILLNNTVVRYQGINGPGISGGSAIGVPINGAVPEPSTWAMMLLGFFGVAGAMRTRRTVSFAF
jgi:hypothetical protein